MREKLTHILIVAAFGALFYVNSFGNFFVWNDWTLIVENFLIKDLRNLPEIFTSAFWKPLLGEPFQIYRPLVSMSFMMDFSLWGLKPWGYHLTNVSLHVLNSVLVYFLVRCYVSALTALIAALLFAVHPIHTEAVTYISGRGELFMSLFLLGGTVVFLASAKRRSPLLYVASLPFFFLALLAKETAIVSPLWLAAADFAAFPDAWKNHLGRRLLRLLGPLMALVFYFLVRHYFVGVTFSAYSLAAPDFLPHLLTTLKAISLYVALLLLPWRVQFLHPYSAPEALLGVDLLFSVLLLVAAGWGLRQSIRSGNGAVIFAILWFLLGLLPLVYQVGLGLPLLEGWLYFPSVGFFLLIALAINCVSFKSQSRLPLWIGALMGVVLGGVTYQRNWDWKDDLQIALHTSQASPENPVALGLLGNAYFRRGKTQEAERLFAKALQSAPQDPRLHESLGRLYSFVGKDQEALERYQRMRELTPEDPYPYWRIGRFYWRRKNLAEAESYLEKAVRLFPHSSELRNDLAGVYFIQGKVDRARDELEAALKILPRSKTLQKNLEQMLNKNRR